MALLAAIGLISAVLLTAFTIVPLPPIWLFD